MNNVVVIGGGAAGLMAAITAAEKGASVVLLEPNERLGKKINITGKGRCNVTNDTDLDGLMANIPRNGRFLYSALSRFSSRDTMAFFEKAGAALKVERGNRVFPQSDSAFTITDALKRRVKETGVRWVRDRAVDIEVTDGAVTAVRGEKDTYKADRAIIATGGCSYPGTGSTGDGYRLAEALGHTVVEPKGSLVPLVSDDGCCREMQGLALKNVELTVTNAKKKVIFHELGEMLFTHFGISGPLVLSASAHLRDWEKGGYRLSIDLKPALDEQKLESRILRDISENPNRDGEKLLGGLVPHSMVAVVMKRLDWPKGLKSHSITKEQRRALVQLLKDFPISVTGVRPVSEAIVTAGGVKVGEVSPNTMESKLVSGLYFAGEVLDVDAYTGGFNLQIAWASGRLAGLAAAEKEEW
ncbi:MAG: NAD(P)/FAD-dependent oxidoreductase [Oscillospiraceae bacterium]|nr:NAD(P)/FAD-dependent oxidoreductase [Oscillospiraceae bacterium]